MFSYTSFVMSLRTSRTSELLNSSLAHIGRTRCSPLFGKTDSSGYRPQRMELFSAPVELRLTTVKRFFSSGTSTLKYWGRGGLSLPVETILRCRARDCSGERIGWGLPTARSRYARRSFPWPARSDARPDRIRSGRSNTLLHAAAPAAHCRDRGRG